MEGNQGAFVTHAYRMNPLELRRFVPLVWLIIYVHVPNSGYIVDPNSNANFMTLKRKLGSDDFFATSDLGVFFLKKHVTLFLFI